jgi:hypothetical protein
MNTMGKIDYKMLEQKKEKFEKMSVAELEILAIELPSKNESDKPLLHELFYVRKQKLNKDFIFTPEHIEKFLWVDREIKMCVQKLQQQGEKVLKELEKLIHQKDAFFMDYEIEAFITPVILELDNETAPYDYRTEDKIIELIDWIETNCVQPSILNFRPNAELLYKNSCWFGDLNWNTSSLIGVEDCIFANHHIGYGMHVLCDHSHWSFPDIMRINNIWCDLRVLYQRYKRIGRED